MDFKNNTKHRYKTIQGLRSFKNTLPKEVKKIISKKGHIYSETLDNWRSIVGEELFKVCYPKSFKNSNRISPSYLSIMVKRGHEVDIEYSKKKILSRLNSYLGYNAVEKLKFVSFEGNDGVFISYPNNGYALQTNIQNKGNQPLSSFQVNAEIMDPNSNLVVNSAV